jgi:uncharacterized membrane protein YphA (DoxX/SURF4 family)
MAPKSEFLRKLDDIEDQVLRHGKHILPTIARLCLIATFLEDGVRMLVQWSEQCEYMDITWGCGKILCTIFVLFNLIGELGGCVMIMGRFRVTFACGVLFFIVVLQTSAYRVLGDLKITIRNFALIGALLLVLAESRLERKSLLAGLPSGGYKKTRDYLQLFGRGFVSFMFITLLRSDLCFAKILQDTLSSTLMVLVIIGYKTQLSALTLVVLLGALNFYHNAWWNISSYEPHRDMLKYDFFQTLSVIGGLLMIVVVGPGGVLMDKQKKMW